MKDNHSNNEIQQQGQQQGSAIPPSDKLPMGINHDEKSDDQQKNSISTLEKRLKNTNRMMEILTGLLVIITFGGVAIAYSQAKTAKIQFGKDQRPYVISRAVPHPFIPNQDIMVDFFNGNYGKSPAIKAGGIAHIFLGDDALLRADQWFKNEAPKVFSRRNETIIPPNTPASNAEARRTTVVSGRPISDEELNSLMTKDFSIVAVMRQAYFDGAGNQYWTDSCVSNLATGAIVDCNTHNEIH